VGLLVRFHFLYFPFPSLSLFRPPPFLCFLFFFTYTLTPHFSTCTVLDTPGKLGKILLGMNRALGEIPLTVKLRTGVKDGRNTAHKIMPRFGAEWGVGCVTVSLAAVGGDGLEDADDIGGSYMGGQGSSGTRAWRIGIISSSVWMQFVSGRPTKIVGPPPSFPSSG
jgi:hypothetical protein